jgi:hypothetical protein
MRTALVIGGTPAFGGAAVADKIDSGATRLGATLRG